MSEHTVNHDHMEALKALSDTNLKISEAKGELFRLQETETEYLEVREKKAMERIQKVVENSRLMLDEANRNYTEIREIGAIVSDLGKSVITLHKDLRTTLDGFEERNILWEREIGEQQDEIMEARKLLKVERTQFENDKQSFLQTRKKVVEDEKRIRDKWGEIERAIKRLKEGRI